MDLKDELQKLEESHLFLETRSSPEKLARILADDFWEIGSSGKTFDKTYCLEHGVVLSDMTLHHYEIEPLASDVVLATYYIEDTTRKRNTLRSSIWKKTDGRWQLSFHQGTITDLTLYDFRKEMDSRVSTT